MFKQILTPLVNVAVWLMNVVLLLLGVTSPIIGLIAVFVGWKMFFRDSRRKLGAMVFAAGAIGTVAGVASLAIPGRLAWLYAIYRDLNPFS